MCILVFFYVPKHFLKLGIFHLKKIISAWMSKSVCGKLVLAIKGHLFTNWVYSQKMSIHACGFQRNKPHKWFGVGGFSLLNHWPLECEVLVLLFSWKQVSKRWKWAVLRKPLIRIRVRAAVINTLLHQLRKYYIPLYLLLLNPSVWNVF